MLPIEREQGNAVPELLNHGRNHHGPQAHRVPRDHYKYNLKREADANEAVIKSGMGDRGRILPPDHVKHEIKRSKYQDAPNSGNPENNLGEFHLVILARLGGHECPPHTNQIQTQTIRRLP